MSNTKHTQGPVPNSPPRLQLPQEVPAAHRAGTEPISRLLADFDYCISEINPEHDVAKVMRRIRWQLGTADTKPVEQSAAPDLLAALEGLFEGGFIEAGTREQSQWARELESRLVACRAAIAKANTQAAEPALLAALEDITGEAAFTGLPESKQEAIYAAIAKARGES